MLQTTVKHPVHSEEQTGNNFKHKYKYMNIYSIKSLTNSLIDKQYPIHFGNRSLRESVVDVW